MGVRGIKSRVFIQFWILFFLSMLLFDVLVMFFYLERTITHHTEQKRATLTVVCDNLHQALHTGDGYGSVQKTMAVSGKDRFYFAENAPSASNRTDMIQSSIDLEAAVHETLAAARPITRRTGGEAGRLFSSRQSVIVTCPLIKDGEVVAAAGLQSSLAAVYQDFLRIQKIALVFAAVNSFFFALLGNRQLSRIYFKPLKRLAKRAEIYQDEDPLYFSVRKEDNEFANLSASLNKMLHRIADDKRTLKEHIDSLSTANIELKKAQNDVIRAEKLATVGRLTSGIAHEIGNPVGIVLGYLDLMRQSDLPPQERDDFIERSEKEITRINYIIRQLLDMSRSSTGEPKPVSIHDVLRDLISVFNFQPAAEAIAFEVRFSAVQDMVFADPDQIRQVFLNILLNAVDALNSRPPDRPRITLATEGTVDDDASGVRAEAQKITIRIQDNGPGIDAAHLSQVFDPFFTTKQPGKGTGLGLSVSFMIIENLGGRLSVTSDENAGAVFTVTLPLTRTGKMKQNHPSTG